MSRSYSFDVAGVTYKGETASAKSQFEALHIIGSTPIVSSLKDGVSDMGAVVLILQLSMDKINRLMELLVVDHVIRKEDEIPVGENLFQEDIQDYYLLLSKAMRENLKNFWKLRRPTEKDAKAAEPSKG